MASAVLPSRNGSYWGEGKVYMRKYGSNNPHFNNFIQTNPNPSRNRSPSHALTRQIHESNTPYHWNHNEMPSPSPAPAMAAENGFHHREYLTFNLSAYSRIELRELEGRLRSELEKVRSLRAQIEKRSGYLGSQFSDVAAVAAAPPPRPPPIQVDFPLQSNDAPKANQNKNKASGKKREIPFGSVRGPKRHHTVVSDSSPLDRLLASTMKRCNQILVKLMKHKAGWVFNAPVDAVSLGLHDYHVVIKNPMDLGTVQARLDKKVYKSPIDFANDVRLTFDNARIYNPKGSDVHVMAGTLVSLFEKLFGPAYSKFEAQHRFLAGPALMNSKESEAMRVQEGLTNTPSVRVAGVRNKLPKPKARDPIKRLMSFEEKENLGLGLQELPAEKMGAMLDIIKRRNSHMTPEGDEIELDIEALDVETLWELDRFVGNHQKAEKKMRRQGGANTELERLVEQIPEVAIQKSKKGCDAAEEDVDIGEDIPVNIFPPVEIERDDSSSSSSGSDSSSSSGSDSGSDSEEDSVQSPFVESKGVEAVT